MYLCTKFKSNMIEEFSVENFYSIRSQQTLSFVPTADKQLRDMYTVEVKPGVGLLRLGIVYGSNASGKSKLLQALDFFRKIQLNYPSSRVEEIDFYPFLLDDHSRNELSTMQMSFYLDGERYVQRIRFARQRIEEEQLLVYASNRPSLLYSRTYVRGNDSTRVEFGQAIGLGRRDQDIIAGNTLNNCSVLAAFGKSNVEQSRLNKVYDWFNGGFSAVINPANSSIDFLHERLRQDKDGSLGRFIQQFLLKSDFNISQFSMSPDGQSILFKHHTESGEGMLPEALESRGTIRYMAVSTLLKYLLEDNQMMMIDELETSLHYELVLYFLRVYLASGSGRSQLLIATHDINLLDEDFIRRDTVWFTDKNEEAETELVRLSALGLHKNVSPYHAYRQGKLVKLPFTGEIYMEA